jgi:hypothetical protein
MEWSGRPEAANTVDAKEYIIILTGYPHLPGSTTLAGKAVRRPVDIIVDRKGEKRYNYLK